MLSKRGRCLLHAMTTRRFIDSSSPDLVVHQGAGDLHGEHGGVEVGLGQPQLGGSTHLQPHAAAVAARHALPHVPLQLGALAKKI